MSSAIQLSTWIRANLAYRREALTHLKLQKLAFYCYGASLAYDVSSELEPLTFEAWAHGPVCREIWKEFRTYGGNPISWVDPNEAPKYSRDCAAVLGDVLAVYGILDAWSLRQESHLEKPWIESQRNQGTISTDVLRRHFEKKFRTGDVRAPKYLLATSSATLDDMVLKNHPSLETLAAAVRRGNA